MRRVAPAAHASTARAGMLVASAWIISLIVAWLFRDMLAIWLATPEVGHDAIRLPARVALKAGQLAVPALLALAAVLLALSPRQAGRPAFGRVMVLVLAWLMSVTFGARLGNLGMDSIRELVSANAQEALDFLRGFVLAPAYTRPEMLMSLGPAATVALSQALPRLRLSPGQGPGLAVTIVALLAIPVGAALVGLLTSELTDRRLTAEFSQQARRAAAAATQAAEPVDVVLVIGESAAAAHQSLLGYPRPTNAALEPFRQDLVIVRDAIAPYSFTRESLVRLLSISADPMLDQHLPEAKLSRANLVEFLHQRGIATYWLSNQSIAGRWDFASQLFGRKAQHTVFLNFELANDIQVERRFDHELLPALSRSIATSTRPSLYVLHGYAGHHDYCRNIPPMARQRHDDTASQLPWPALFGTLVRRSEEVHRRELDCYDSAMAYVSQNLAAVIEGVRALNRPFLVLFVSDHGEDPAGGTYHDAAVTRLAHLHVPVFIYANPALQALRPEWLANARRNAELPYATAWLSDTLVDAFGIRLADRRLQSLLSPTIDRMPRRSLLRNELVRGLTWVDIDESSGSSRDRADGLLRFRRLAAQRDSDRPNRVCVHRANTYYKFMAAVRVAECVELDLVVSAEHPAPWVTHPPLPPSGLSLDHLLPMAKHGLRQIWLDVKTSDTASLERLKTYLQGALSELPGLDVLVEVEVGVELSDGQINALRSIRQLARTRTLFYIPYTFASSCLAEATASRCRDDVSRVESALRRGEFQDISFDLSLLSFAQRLPSYASMRRHVWGTTNLPPHASNYESVILPAITDFER